jgi:hypothetical protein
VNLPKKLLIRNWLSEYKFFVFAEPVEQAEGALVTFKSFIHISTG